MATKRRGPRIAAVKVPDPRVDALAEFKPERRHNAVPRDEAHHAQQHAGGEEPAEAMALHGSTSRSPQRKSTVQALPQRP